jgi:hypothetical protein
MADLAPYILRAYLAFRNPKYFLWVLVAYIAGSVWAHCGFGYDSDWGMTNLVLSIEASTAGAVLMMVAERTSRVQDELATLQREQIAQLVAMVDGQRGLLEEHLKVLQQIRANDAALLDYLKGKRDDSLARDGSGSAPV